MKHTIRNIVLLLALIFTLTACGEDEALTQFQTDFENFCINLSTLDTCINEIDASSETATAELLGYVDQLGEQFEILAGLTFPDEFSYLTDLAAEANEYMQTAVDAYHTAYEGETFAENYSDYAYENYKRAYKRVQIILIYLHGDVPEDSDLVID